jgi:uncharacterized protein YciI
VSTLHILRLRYRGAEEEAAPHVPAHAAYLDRHHRAGTFLASGQTVPSEQGGAIIARGTDRAEIEKIAENDPFVCAGVAEYEIITVDVGRIHPALAGLVGVGPSRVRAPGEPPG